MCGFSTQFTLKNNIDCRGSCPSFMHICFFATKSEPMRFHYFMPGFRMIRHRVKEYAVHVKQPLWRALRRVSRMQRGRAGKGGSEVGRGYRNLPTSVFRVVRARSAWGEELEKVSRPLLAARRRATLRVQGAPGRVSSRRGGGVRYGIRHGRRGFRTWDAICRRLLGRSRGLRRDVAWRTEARFRVAAPLP